MKVGLALLAIGLGLIGYSLSLRPYTNQQLFNERYMDLESGQSEEYSKLRAEMLTPKYRMQDYGGTALTVGVALLLLAVFRFRAPTARWQLAAIMVAAPFLSVGAFVFDLIQGDARGEFPHWADTLAIPLMGVPFMLVLLCAWAFLHLGFLLSPYEAGHPLTFALSREANWWLLMVSSATFLLVVLCAVDGTYWYMIPAGLWLYIYLSLAAGRRTPSVIQAHLQPTSPTAA